MILRPGRDRLSSSHMHTHTLVRVVAIAAGLSLLGAGCNPFAAVEKRASDAVGEAIGEGLIEGMAGQGVDLELGKIPANFPSDVLFYPDAQVGSAIMTEQGIAIANIMTTDETQKVVEWYDREYAADGFVKDEGIAKLGLFRVYQKGNVKMTVQTQRPADQDKTLITVTRSESK
jgi:hypothetical protein